jgi:prepilin-type N-terminal cleavage/methylation domain-containing protein
MWNKWAATVIRRSGPSRGERVPCPGFTLAEMLIAMTLLAMILGSVAMAMRGATEAVSFGNEQSRSNVITTLVMDRLRTDIRRADVVALNSPSNTISLTMPSGEQKSYTWSGTAGSRLVYRSAAAPTGVTLAENVVQFKLTSVNQYSAIRGATVPVSVGVLLEVRQGKATTRMETTVRPRRNVI